MCVFFILFICCLIINQDIHTFNLYWKGQAISLTSLIPENREKYLLANDPERTGRGGIPILAKISAGSYAKISLTFLPSVIFEQMSVICITRPK